MSLPLLDIGTTIAIVGLAIAVIKLFLEHRKAKKDMEFAKEYIRVLSKLVESYKKGLESQQELEKQNLWWDQLKTIGGAFWEAYKYSEES